MDMYLLKFTGCLVTFWLVYVLLLEKQKMHQFKRFYLLGAFVAALIIPLLTITYYVEPVMDFGTYDSNSVFTPPYFPAEIPIAEAPPTDNLPIVLWSIYALGVVLFSIRFITSLITLHKRISKNETIKQHPFIYVLMQHYQIPHSFFNYIFFSKSKYKTGDIPREVILHEETHAKQLHSLDILVVELLQIVFWFHPLVYLLKHHIKLNHEFLADQAVLEHGLDAKNYQHILLQFSSSDSYRNNHNNALSSAINYSSFKKRFTVMKTQTSKRKIWVSIALLLPIAAVLFYSFSTKEYVEKDTELSNNSGFNLELNDNNDLKKIAKEYHYTRAFFTVKDENGEYEKKRFNDLSEEYKRKWVYVESIPFYKKEVLESDFQLFKNSNAYIIQVNQKNIKNEDLNNYAVEDFVTFSVTPISELAKMKENYVVNLVTEDIHQSYITASISLYNGMLSNYEEDLKQIDNIEDIGMDLVSIYEFARNTYGRFSPEIIKDNGLVPPTEIPSHIVEKFYSSFLSIPVLKIDSNENLFINNEPTSLETIKADFNKVTNFKKSKMSLEADGRRIDKALIDKIMLAIGDNLNGITVASGQAQVYDLNNKTVYDPNAIDSQSKNEMGKSDVAPTQDPIIEYQKAATRYTDALKIYLKGSQTDNRELKILKALADKIYKTFSTEDIKAHNIKMTPPIPAMLSKSRSLQQKTATPEEVAAYNAWAKKINGKTKILSDKAVWYPPIDAKIIEFDGVYQRMTVKQKENSAKFPYDDIILKNAKLDFQKRATYSAQQNISSTKEIAEYNAWAKDFTKRVNDAEKNTSNEDYPIIKKKDLNRYQSIYNRMTEEQRSNSEPFPNIPPPPPPPPSKDKSKGGPNANIPKGMSFTFSSLKNAKKIDWDLKKAFKENFYELSEEDSIRVVLEIDDKIMINDKITRGYTSEFKGTFGKIDMMYEKIKSHIRQLRRK